MPRKVGPVLAWPKRKERRGLGLFALECAFLAWRAQLSLVVHYLEARWSIGNFGHGMPCPPALGGAVNSHTSRVGNRWARLPLNDAFSSPQEYRISHCNTLPYISIGFVW